MKKYIYTAFSILIIASLSLSACSSNDPLTEAMYVETLYVWDGGSWNQITTNGGAGGDVSASGNIVDHSIVRGDGGAKIVQDSGITIDDADNISGAGTINSVDITSHAARHIVSGGDTIFPADPNADKYLMWDDDGGGGGGALSWEDAGGGGVNLTVSGAVVFNGASPTSWTDLDLSGTVGAKTTLVILAIDSTSDLDAVSVRMNGDSANYFDIADEANAYGCALGHHDDSTPLVLICVTDSSGVIEWITESTQTATVTIIAYIN